MSLFYLGMISAVTFCFTTAGIRHQPGSQPQNAQVLEAQRALQGNINEGLQTVQNVGQELATRASLPPLGTDSVSNG